MCLLRPPLPGYGREYEVLLEMFDNRRKTAEGKKACVKSTRNAMDALTTSWPAGSA
jgi:hypothetical protein